MSEQQTTTESEQDPAITRQLADACLDVRMAIRAHEVRVLKDMRRTRQKESRQTEGTAQNVAMSGLVVNLVSQPSLAVIRENMRRHLRVPADQVVYNRSNSQACWQVVETEDSAANRLPDGDIGLHIDEITRTGDEDSRRTLFEVQVRSGELSVTDDTGTIDPSGFAPALHIVQTYRGLYP